MAVHLDPPRYLKCSVSCAEILLRAKALHHWKTTLGILAYIKGIRDSSIILERGLWASVSFEVFPGADYASRATDRCSASGGVIMCGGACVNCCSRTQKCVKLLITEEAEEYVALGDAVKECYFF